MRRAAVLLLVTAAAGAQGPPPKPFPDALEAFEAAFDADDGKRLAAAIAELARAGLLSEDKREQTAARLALKRALKHPAPEVRIAAAKGYGTMRQAGSSRDLKAVLKAAIDGREPHEVGLAVIEAWGDIHDAGSHAELLALIKRPVDDKPRRALAQAATRALKSYRALEPKKRAQVLDDFMRAYDQLYAFSHRRAKEHEVAWWEVLEREMAAAFNGLTGQSCEDYHDCYDWWQENRRRVREGG